MKQEADRMEELIQKLVDGCACVYTHVDTAPETFAVDIAGLFKADPKKDVLRHVLIGGEEVYEAIAVVIPEPKDPAELFVKLADYVNGIGMDYAFCSCVGKDGNYKEYEIDKGDEYVEGGETLMVDDFDCVSVCERNMILLRDRLELGAEDPDMLPSPTLMFIDQGTHYIKSLIGPDDSPLQIC